MKQRLFNGLFISMLFANISLADDISATINWSQRVDMSTPVSGVVDTVSANVGSKVNKNDVLLRLQTARFEAALTSATANKKDAQYKLKEAEREWDRAQELYDRTVLSDRDLQLAENSLIAAKAAYVTASANYITAKQDLEDSVIRAPFDAVVLKRHVQPGQTIVTRMHAEPLVTIAATEHYHANGAVPVVTANKLTSGQAVSVTVSGEKFVGTLISVGYEPIKNTETYSVVVRFTSGGEILRVGQAATINLP